MLYIGIDVGGTNLKAGLTDETGRLLAAARRPLDFRGAETFAADLADLAAEVLSTAGAAPGDAEGVGIGLPGRHTCMTELRLTAWDFLYPALCTLPLLWKVVTLL